MVRDEIGVAGAAPPATPPRKGGSLGKVEAITMRTKISRPFEITHGQAKQVYKANVKAKKRGAVDALAPVQWVELLHQQGFKCAMCGHRAKLVITYITPIQRGGLNRIDNVLGMCVSCHLFNNVKARASNEPTT